jgi:hypothetical protein
MTVEEIKYWMILGFSFILLIEEIFEWRRNRPEVIISTENPKRPPPPMGSDGEDLRALVRLQQLKQLQEARKLLEERVHKLEMAKAKRQRKSFHEEAHLFNKILDLNYEMEQKKIGPIHAMGIRMLNENKEIS